MVSLKTLIGRDLTDAKGEPLVLTAASAKTYEGGICCDYQGLIGLEGCPQVLTSLVCDNNNLSSMIGGPQKVGTLMADHNRLTTIEGLPKVIDDLLSISHNRLTSLRGIHKVIKELHGSIFIDNNPIKEAILGLLMIKGLTRVRTDHMFPGDNHGLFDACVIINKYLPNTNGMEAVSRCQDELEEAGYGDFAEL